MDPAASLASGTRSLANPSITYPLEPVLTAGCPQSSTDAFQYPLEVAYEYGSHEAGLFGQAGQRPPMDHWQPLLPPLSTPSLGEGGTPLLEFTLQSLDVAGLMASGEASTLRFKDESQNPTWSHKDRLNRCTVSAAVREDARGVVAASTGNHGAAAAAYAARAGLPCVVLTASRTPPAVQAFIRSYGAVVLAVDEIEARQRAVDRLTEDHGFHPVSSRTGVHTGHPWGPEGYKTIAYELFGQLQEQVPGTVVVPTCYAELLYGVWKGFRELEALGVADRTPRLVACEPGVRAPLCQALERGEAIASVDARPTEAYSIKATTSSVRGYRAIRESDGLAVGFTEAHLQDAQHRLARAGWWQESSGAAGVAGLAALGDLLEGKESTTAADERDAGPAEAVDADGTPVERPRLEGPVVVIGTSSGFKDGAALPGDRGGSRREPGAESTPMASGDGWYAAPSVDSSWPAIRSALAAHDGLPVEDVDAQ